MVPNDLGPLHTNPARGTALNIYVFVAAPNTHFLTARLRKPCRVGDALRITEFPILGVGDFTGDMRFAI
jgi:hypothetical protein